LAEHFWQFRRRRAKQINTKFQNRLIPKLHFKIYYEFFINKFNQNKLIVVLLIFISLGVILAFSASACQNTCLNSGDKQCATATVNNTTYSGHKICGDYNNDGCREWSGIYACPSGKVCNPVDYSCCTPATCSGWGINAALGLMVVVIRLPAALANQVKPVLMVSALPVAPAIIQRNATMAICIGIIPATPRKS